MKRSEKRGDTLIEVMFAIAIFSAVAIISIAMMNLGVANSERSLEMSTARDELNAQAEALRFIHSSYTSELTLPACDAPGVNPLAEKCQQFKRLWEQQIVANAMNPYDPNDPHNTDNYSIPSPLGACDTVYNDNNKILSDNRAFVINTRQISRVNDNISNDIYISAANATTRDLFQPASLNARIIYIRGQAGETYDEDSDNSSVTGALSTDPLLYRAVGQIEGIWTVAVRDAGGQFYDFYIQACWYAPGSNAPTSLDTIIRLYNPKGL